jgi:hypothetical protein
MEICIVLLILLIVLYVVVNYGKGKPKQNAALLRRRGCPLPGEAVIAGQQITWTTGMQYNIHWTLPGEFAFTATYSQGLLVSLCGAMTDTAGGYVVHLRAPSGNELMYGVSDIMYGGKIHCLARVPRTLDFRPRRYELRATTGHISLWEDGRPVFDANLASLFNNSRSVQNNLKFFGFGSSSEDSADRTITQLEMLY